MGKTIYDNRLLRTLTFGVSSSGSNSGDGSGDAGVEALPAITNEALWDYYRPADWPVLPEPISDDEVTVLVDRTISNYTCKIGMGAGTYVGKVEVLVLRDGSYKTVADQSKTEFEWTDRWFHGEWFDAKDLIESSAATERYAVVRYTFEAGGEERLIIDTDVTGVVDVSINLHGFKSVNYIAGSDEYYSNLTFDNAISAMVWHSLDGQALFQGWSNLKAFKFSKGYASNYKSYGANDFLNDTAVEYIGSLELDIADGGQGPVSFSDARELRYIGSIKTGTASTLSFRGNASLVEIGKISIPNITSIKRMFFNCSSLRSIGSIDLSGLSDYVYQGNSSQVSDAFTGCLSLERVVLCNIGMSAPEKELTYLDFGLAGTADAPRALKSILMPSTATAWTGADFDLSYNQLDHDALRMLVISLPRITEQHTITITGNPGAVDTPEDIVAGALRKNWVLSGITVSEAVG